MNIAERWQEQKNKVEPSIKRFKQLLDERCSLEKERSELEKKKEKYPEALDLFELSERNKKLGNIPLVFACIVFVIVSIIMFAVCLDDGEGFLLSLLMGLGSGLYLSAIFLILGFIRKLIGRSRSKKNYALALQKKPDDCPADIKEIKKILSEISERISTINEEIAEINKKMDHNSRDQKLSLRYYDRHIDLISLQLNKANIEMLEEAFVEWLIYCTCCSIEHIQETQFFLSRMQYFAEIAKGNPYIEKSNEAMIMRLGNSGSHILLSMAELLNKLDGEIANAAMGMGFSIPEPEFPKPKTENDRKFNTLAIEAYRVIKLQAQMYIISIKSNAR